MSEEKGDSLLSPTGVRWNGNPYFDKNYVVYVQLLSV